MSIVFTYDMDVNFLIVLFRKRLDSCKNFRLSIYGKQIIVYFLKSTW